jgi:hypothetical protein
MNSIFIFVLALLAISSSISAQRRHRHRHRSQDETPETLRISQNRNPFEERVPESDLIAKAITLPRERAKVIRNCPDCTGASPGEDVCSASRQCNPLGTRCSDLKEFTERKITTVSSHRCKLSNGMPGVSLFCCERGSKEGQELTL